MSGGLPWYTPALIVCVVFAALWAAVSIEDHDRNRRDDD